MAEMDVKDFLSLGSMGHQHLLVAAQKSFRAAETLGASPEAGTMLEYGARLLCMSWLEAPLDGPLASQVAYLADRLPVMRKLMKPEMIELARHIGSSVQPGSDSRCEELFFAGDYDALDRRIENMAGKGQVLAGAAQAFIFQRTRSHWAWLVEYVKKYVLPTEPAVGGLLLADALLGLGNFEQAAHLYDKGLGPDLAPGLRFRLGTALAGAGEKDQAALHLAECVESFPLDSSPLFMLDGLVNPPSRAAVLPGKCIISIYSFNKRKELAQTLESVLASDLNSVGDVTVRVLINGSQDGSLEVAEQARGNFGARLEVVALPVNVGAPAARNWLLEAARKDGAQWIVFLDDDVLVPTDWLSGLASGVEEYPDAGVWGCRVSDAVSPSVTQHGDAFLLGHEETVEGDHPFSLYAPAGDCLFPGQLVYRRRSATVTGCCHLFSTKNLIANNGFDLLFSPSQYDDFDSDLRLLGAGRSVVYLGDVNIRHMRVAQKLQTPSSHAQIQSENHLSLLEKRHSEHLNELLEEQSVFVDQDVEAARQRLKDKGYLSKSV